MDGPSTQLMSQARSTVMNVNEPAGSQASWTIFAGMKLNEPGPSLARFPSHARVAVPRMIVWENHDLGRVRAELGDDLAPREIRVSREDRRLSRRCRRRRTRLRPHSHATAARSDCEDDRDHPMLPHAPTLLRAFLRRRLGRHFPDAQSPSPSPRLDTALATSQARVCCPMSERESTASTPPTGSGQPAEGIAVDRGQPVTAQRISTSDSSPPRSSSVTAAGGRNLIDNLAALPRGLVDYAS